MFKKKRSYYKPYRGGDSGGNKKLVFFALLAVIALALMLVFFVLPEYIVFTTNGFYFTFQDRPEEGGADGADVSKEPSVTADEDFNIVINNPAPPETALSAVPAVLAVSDDIANLLRDGYGQGLIEDAKEAGCNTLCFEIKAKSGVVQIPVISAYSSQGSQAANASEIKEALEALKAEDPGIAFAARVSALCDDIAPRAFLSGALTTSGVRWLDAERDSWISPYTPMAEEYICDIIGACASAGFDMVILDHLSFPTAGRLNLIKYPAEDSPEARYEAIEAIMTAAYEAAYTEKISLSLILETNSADDPVSGQSAARLAQYCHTMFYKGAPDDAFADELTASAAETSCKIGCISSSAFAVPENGLGMIASRIK